VPPAAALPPPAFLQLAGHPLRWRLLAELAHSDRSVRELTGAVGEPQNLVSYHLGRLRAGGLVSMRRSSADRRDAYYTIDLAVCGELLTAVGAALHPGLRLALPPPPAWRGRARPRVLYLCTGNSARSQLAQALMEHLAGGTVAAFSAGSNPKSLHPNAVRVMREYGVDIGGRRTRHLDRYLSRPFTAVVTLCDRVREVCPEFPGHPQRIHWSIADPATAGATDEESYPAFRATATELAARNRFLLHRLEAR
jgi:protein-tyrosine-phosphatase/DNA-binding transcriptional ArsR family regulator